MTLRHVVLMHFETDADPAYVERLSHGIAALARDVPEIATAFWGADVTDVEDHADYVLMFDFTDRAAYERYRVHEAHKRFIADFMRDVPMRKTRIQFEF